MDILGGYVIWEGVWCYVELAGENCEDKFTLSVTCDYHSFT